MDWASVLLRLLINFVTRVLGALGEWLILRHPFIGFAFALALVAGAVAWARKVMN